MDYCIVKGCKSEKRQKRRTPYCNVHYRRLLRYGNPTKVKVERHGDVDSPEYTAWKGMQARCNNPNNKAYKNYGGRGIKVCDRWMGLKGYSNFLNDMGRKPTKYHSLDRINNDGNYEPRNCRWANGHQQGINRRNNNRHPNICQPTGKKWWWVSINAKGKTVYSKRFKTLEEAIIARDNALKTIEFY